MSKQILLHAAGIAVLSLLCACGPAGEEKKEEVKQTQELPAEPTKPAEAPEKEALSGMPGQDQAGVQTATQEETTKVATNEEPGENPLQQTGDETTEQKA